MGLDIAEWFEPHDGIGSLERSLRERIAALEAERDAWGREWKLSLHRIVGPTNEAAAEKLAEQILETLRKWEKAHGPRPFMVTLPMDAKPFIPMIKHVISARTDELQSQLGAAEAKLAAVSRLDR